MVRAMTPLLHPFLVNERFGDPALYVEFLFEKRALLFDLGDLSALEPRKILRVSDIFVSHAHMDHFVGFDRVLRTLLGRDKTLRLFGPEGFIDRVAHKLAGYSWNLVDRFDSELVLIVTEMLSQTSARTTSFRLSTTFRREDEAERRLENGTLLEDEVLRVRAVVLDHQIPCLAFAVAERAHINVWKNRLAALGLPVGAWLRDLKLAVLSGEPEDRLFRIPLEGGEGPDETRLPLGQLKREVLRIVPGQKIGYVVDALCSFANARRIVRLVRDADVLFIESTFAEGEAERAADRYHLTTSQAGRLGRLARARRLEPFHFSPRYADDEVRLWREVEAAFGQTLGGARLDSARDSSGPVVETGRSR